VTSQLENRHHDPNADAVLRWVGSLDRALSLGSGLPTVWRFFVWRVIFVNGLNIFDTVRATEVSSGGFSVANPQFWTQAPLRSGFFLPIKLSCFVQSSPDWETLCVALTMYRGVFDMPVCSNRVQTGTLRSIKGGGCLSVVRGAEELRSTVGH